MIDVSDKPSAERRAVARGKIYLYPETIEAVKQGTTAKGDVLAAAQIAAVNAAKSTSNLIPMCHQIPLTLVDVQFDIRREYIGVKCDVRADYKTGVEMEALVGVNVALMTIWDMVKYLEKDEHGQYNDTKITDIQVTVKFKEGDQWV